jgi:hypothetical protein
MATETKKFTVIRGHVSPETAYLVGDYPFGFRLRCKIRYWLERATKGSQKGRVRFVSQTTNPKHGDCWNKSKGSTYSAFDVMYLDEQEHVHHFPLSDYLWPEHFGAFVADGIYGQLDEAERGEVDTLVRVSRIFSPVSWAEWDELVGHVRTSLQQAPPDFDDDQMYDIFGRGTSLATIRERFDLALAYVRAGGE